MKTCNLLNIIILATALLGCYNNEEEPNIFHRLSYFQPEGFKDSLLTGTFEVFENRETMKGRKISLFVAVTPALVRDSLKEPIFIIDGGPGVGASHQSYFYTEIDTNYRRYHDIVYVDVRGTGKSNPLHCIDLQTKSSPQEYFNFPYPKEDLKACLEAYQDTVDFNFYKTRYIVEDLEEVRQWLGYNKINLLGISFGGKVSLRYMDRFPNAIHRVVLHAPDAPNIDYLSKRGRFSQRALDLLFDYCGEDSLCNSVYPNIEKEFYLLMKRLKTGGIKQAISFNDSIYHVEITWPPVAQQIAKMLYQDASYVQIPYIIHEAFLGNYGPLLDVFDVTNTETNYFFADGMWLSNICGEDIPEATRNYEEKEKESFLGDYTYQTRKISCDIWPVDEADETEYKSVISNIPTLILSGYMDPTLPPETGAEIASKLSNSQHIIIPYMAHMFADLSHLECYDNYVVAFFENREEELNTNCFNEMKPQPFKLPATEDNMP